MQAQHTITIDAKLIPEKQLLNITQEIKFVNASNKIVNEIYLNDWANSFSSKTTPLAKRFAENYDSAFHFEKEKERGKTTILNISNTNSKVLSWQREEADIIKVTLDKPLLPSQNYTLKLMYSVKLPKDKYTRYGVTKNNEYKLRYWYISPAVFDGTWHTFSNKNTEDFYLSPSTFIVSVTILKNIVLFPI